MEPNMEFKESEQIFRKFSEHSLAGIYLLQEESFVYVNPKFTEIFGYTTQECVNTIHFSQLVHPDDRGFIKTQFQKRISGKIASDHYGFRGIKKNGETIHVELYGSYILYKGRPAAMGTVLDVTSRKQAEAINRALFSISNAVNTTRNLEDLYESIHGSLSSIMDVTNFFIALVDPAERVLRFPYYVDTMDNGFSPVIHLDSDDSLSGLVVSRRSPVLLKKEQLEMIADQKGLWGSMPLIWMGSPLMVKDEVIGVVATQSYLDPHLYGDKELEVLSMVSDQIAISIDRKRAQDEKAKAEQISVEHEKMALVGQVAGKIAHDFNNLLTVIMGNLELAIMDCKEDELKKSLEFIYKETIQGRILTKNLVAFARDQEPRQEFFRINEKIDMAVNLLKKDLEKIEVIKAYKPKVPELFADPGMIEHALVNLLQNAIHATGKKEHPRIIIRTDCTDKMICFEIEDNGCGIPKEKVEHIFMPSFTLKGHNDATGSYGPGIKGTGYGLSNTKKYIEQHDGNIAFQSVFGKGTKFTIQFPVIKKKVMP